jgi:LPS O-antigen subunit length determinant protein (WzzB/FepE family)
MSSEPDTPSEEHKGEGEISLASVLNILWRRRWIVIALPALGLIAGIVYGQVVTPLYEATATIRPGITAFDRNGGGRREWRLKDLTRWFESGMYRPYTAELMGRDPSDVPLVRADFIQRGLQNIQGGNVITLSVLDASPENAVDGLQTSLAAFTEYAMADTLSNSIVLTRRGLEIQIDELRRYQSVLEARVDSLNADLAVARVESLQIDDEAARLAFDITRLRDKREVMAERKAALEQRLVRLEENREELARTRTRVRERVGSDVSDAPSGVRPQAVITDAEVLRGLVTSTAELDRDAATVSSVIDSLEREIGSAEREAAFLETRNRTLIAFQRAEAGRLMHDLRMARDFQVPNAIRSVQLRVREKLGQLYALSPIEKIGRVQVSDDPVRPRKKRAITILTFLGLVGGIAGAYVFDYLWSHRRRIFRD